MNRRKMLRISSAAALGPGIPIAAASAVVPPEPPSNVIEDSGWVYSFAPDGRRWQTRNIQYTHITDWAALPKINLAVPAGYLVVMRSVWLSRDGTSLQEKLLALCEL